MNQREKRLGITLAVLLLIVGLFGGYFLMLSPWLEKRAAITKLKNDNQDRDLTTAGYIGKSNQLNSLYEKSLPADPATARREYDLLIAELLRKSGVPQGFTISQKVGDDKARIPHLPTSIGETNQVVQRGKEKYAYQKVALNVKLTKVDMKMLGEFLRAYHEVQLLQQIQSMKITRKDDAGGGTAGRRNRDRSNPEEWKDLDVEFTTEALILDGVENRKSTYAVSAKSSPAGLGGAMYTAALNDHELTRKVWISQANFAVPSTKSDNTSYVSTSTREYGMLVGKDLFHGPLPKELPPAPPPPPPPAPVLVDIASHIKLNEICRRGDGSASFQLRDIYNNFIYHCELIPKGELVKIEVSKKEIGPSGKPFIGYRDEKSLIIGDGNKTKTNVNYKIVALDGNQGVIFSGPPITGQAASGEVKTAAPTTTSERPRFGSGSGSGRGSSNSKLPSAHPSASILGGFAVLSASNDSFYYLKVGGSISQMKKITVAQVKEYIKQNTAEGLNPYLNPEIQLPLTPEVAISTTPDSTTPE